MIRSIPTRYRGKWFRSGLEADWAATLDDWGCYWEYEPGGVDLSNDTYYRPDFHLPSQRVWCEVKGPHDEGLGKAAKLQEALVPDGDQWASWTTYLVVVLRAAGPGDTPRWEGSLTRQDIRVMRCSYCDYLVWMDYDAGRQCRLHAPQPDWRNSKPWLPHGALYESGTTGLSFVRAHQAVRGDDR